MIAEVLYFDGYASPDEYAVLKEEFEATSPDYS